MAVKMVCSTETVFTAENKGFRSKNVLMAVKTVYSTKTIFTSEKKVSDLK